MRPDLKKAIQLLAPVLELYESSPLHYIQPVQMFFDRVFPSLLNGQFRLLAKDGKPQSFVNWAFVSPSVSAELIAGRPTIAPDQWSSGPELWFMEIVARDGRTADVVRDVRGVFPPGTRARWMRVGPSGEVQGVGEVRMPGRASPQRPADPGRR